ncbi:MAG: FGGY family carbohydrate kinase [Paracoccaceae bacterium]
MGRDILIGIDAGTSVIKSVAFDLSGKQLAVAARPNRYTTRPDGAAVQDMAETWGLCAATLRELGTMLPDLAARTAGIAVTAQGDGTWLADAQGAPLTEGWIWLDARSADIVRDYRSRPGDTGRFRATGTGLTTCQMGMQLRHMDKHLPELLDRAATAFHPKDFLYWNLTGVRATDPSEACTTFGDFRRRDYDDTVIDALDLRHRRALLPPVVDGSQQSHPLSADAAAQTGLLAGTPVSLGYIDIVCTALGAGIHTGTMAACTVLGSTGIHMRAESTDQIVPNDLRTGYVLLLPIPGMAAQMQSNMAATLNIDWLLGLAESLLADLGQPADRTALISRIDGWLATTRPGTMLYHPYISEAGERGPFVNSTARAGFVGLNASHRFPDLVRAVIEGLAMAARDCYAAMGGAPPEVRISGGAARSTLLRGILASALGVPVRSSARGEAGAAGAAMMAAVAIGAYPDMNACIADWVTPQLGPAEHPDPALVSVYDRLFPAYLQARQLLPPVWDQLAALQSGEK